MDWQRIMKGKALNGWRLFWLISVPLSLFTVLEMLRVDISTGEGVSAMIGHSVRFAVPFIYIVVAASALPVVFPGAVSTWLLRNRKYVGLCFAVAMAWQGLFIWMMSQFQRDYYFENVFYFRDELEGSTGYLFLAAMVFTSFQFGRKLLSQKQWKLLHRSGMYFLWAYPFSVYWWGLYYYGNPTLLDVVFYWTGFAAFALRIAAWGKKRRQAEPDGATVPAFKVAGGALIAFGLVASATGRYWQDVVTTALTAPAWSAELVLWLPFWPFEPFLPLFIIGIGTMLATTTSSSSVPADSSVAR